MTRILPAKEGNLNGVIAESASKGTFTFPIGLRYHAIALKWAYDASTFNLGDITDIKVKLNGKAIMQLSATLLDVRNQALGLSASGTTGILRIPFDRQGLKQRAQEEDTAINTGVADKEGRMVSTFDIEVSFSGDNTTALVEVFSEASPALKLKANGEPYGVGIVNHVFSHPFQGISSAGTKNINDIPRVGVEFMALERIIISTTNDVVTDVEIKKNKNIIFDIPMVLNDILNVDGVRANVAGYQIVDFSLNGDGRGDVPVALMDAQSFDVKLTVSGDMGSDSASFLLIDYLGSIGR